MTISGITRHSKVAELKLDYEWDTDIQNGYLSIDPDESPKLSKALGEMSPRAMFGMAIASAEWIVARLSRHVDPADSALRIEAAWAATVDPRYARLPRPDRLPPEADRRTAGPARMAMRLLSGCHESLLKDDEADLGLNALALIKLVEHVAGKDPVFKKWVPAVLKRAHDLYPPDGKPLAKQSAVAREAFEQGDAPAKPNLGESQAKLLATLDPASNPYLRPAAELVAEGVSAKPYPRGN